MVRDEVIDLDVARPVRAYRGDPDGLQAVDLHRVTPEPLMPERMVHKLAS